jgi:hypothetical protein
VPFGLLALDGVGFAHLRENLVPLLFIGRLVGGPHVLFDLLRELLVPAGGIRSRGRFGLRKSGGSRAKQADCDDSRPKSPSF